MADLPLFPTSLVGSYAQPEWLIDRAKLAGRFPHGCAPVSCGDPPRSFSPRRRTTRRCLPFGLRRSPVWTS